MREDSRRRFNYHHTRATWIIVRVSDDNVGRAKCNSNRNKKVNLPWRNKKELGLLAVHCDPRAAQRRWKSVIGLSLTLLGCPGQIISNGDGDAFTRNGIGSGLVT